jgi:hypothetical protein
MLSSVSGQKAVCKNPSIDGTPRASRTHQAPYHHLALELDGDARASTMKLTACMDHMALAPRKRQQFRSVMRVFVKRNCIPGSWEVVSELQRIPDHHFSWDCVFMVTTKFKIN